MLYSLGLWPTVCCTCLTNPKKIKVVQSKLSDELNVTNAWGSVGYVSYSTRGLLIHAYIRSEGYCNYTYFTQRNIRCMLLQVSYGN